MFKRREYIMSDKKTLAKSIVFYITLGVAIILLVAGFLLPPMGIIDSSVIQAAGILCGFSVIGQLPAIIESAKTVKVQTGNTSLEFTARESSKNGSEAK